MLSKFFIQILMSRPTFGQVSSKFENVQNLVVLQGFITASLFPFYKNLQLLLSIADLQHKFMGLDQHLGQVSSNSENVQNLALHNFIIATLFPFYTNFQLLLRLANLPQKFLDLDQYLGQVSSSSENVQNLVVLHGFIKASLFSFYTNLQIL